MNKSTKMEKFLDFLAGKGFYIILGLCVVAIGVSGYVLLFGGGGDDGEPEPPVMEQLSPSPYHSVLPPAQSSLPPSEPHPSESSAPVVKNDPAVPSPSVPPLTSFVPSLPPSSSSAAPAVTPKPSEAPVSVPPSASPPENPGNGFIRPVKGEILLGHDPEKLVENKVLNLWRVHYGVDFAAELGTVVNAVTAGKVIEIDEDLYLGTYVKVEHEDGLVSMYANLDESVAVVLDQMVKQGDPVGTVGNTAAGESREVGHLHFMMYKDEKAVDPMAYLP